ncbi:hypothetical protein CLOSAC_18050 [Clostridium saccharobutylicum]|uniref:Uncharacterized protein n=1 Tax=Clostridium saccharobutylicum TaxID=169679 RepID=A0A1S8NB73_CLOSA|nr:hypothetical protein CLOSAC_18050 [Clostridium saccharobutylicum]
MLHIKTFMSDELVVFLIVSKENMYKIIPPVQNKKVQEELFYE